MKLTDFIYESNDSKSTENLSEKFVNFIGEYGYDRFVMAGVSKENTSNKEKNFGWMVNYPNEWLARYVDKHYVEFDPVYQKALTATRPFLWDEVIYKGMPEKSKLVMDEAKDFKLKSGVGISIFQPFGRIIGFGISSENEDVMKDKNSLSALQAAACQFLSVYVDLVGEINYEAQAPNVTDKEREVLSWVARGKTKSEIAGLMNVSESAIKRHCENIFSKLEVNNLPYAAVKALRMGLIAPY